MNAHMHQVKHTTSEKKYMQGICTTSDKMILFSLLVLSPRAMSNCAVTADVYPVWIWGADTGRAYCVAHMACM